jgi:3-isopropylmalate/(R)-2-methylmalate dehydratase small subunit
MEPLRQVEGVVAPLDRVDVDTDQIIPKQFLKRTTRTGYGEVLFYDWRYLDDGSPDPEFVLNQDVYQGARILVAGHNFGCGSSREHAAWALADYGFRAVVASGLADIFKGNCFQTGIAPIELAAEDVRRLMDRAVADAPLDAVVDLEALEIRTGDGLRISFELDSFRRRCLLEGLDDVGLTLEREDAISRFEQVRAVPPSWQ